MSHEGQNQKLVYMVNQIAIFFAHEPDDVAVEEIYAHLNKFWERRMRTQIIEIAATGTHGLSPRAFEAVKMLKEFS